MISKFSFRKKRLGIIWAKSKGFIICQVYETYWPCSLIGGPYLSLVSVKSCHNAEWVSCIFLPLFVQLVMYQIQTYFLQVNEIHLKNKMTKDKEKKVVQVNDLPLD